MKNLVRGGVVLSLLSLFVIFIYAQVQTDSALNIANDSQIQLNTNLDLTDKKLENQLNNNQNKINTKQDIKAEKTPQKEVSNLSTDEEVAENGNSLVEKTASSMALGESKGAFVATAYCLKGRTAMGHPVRKGLIAADPRVLKLGSRIALQAGQYSGNYLVSDTGGKIKGRRLDIWVASCAEARRFGRRTVNVGLLK